MAFDVATFKIQFPVAAYPEFTDAVVDLWFPLLEEQVSCLYGGADEGCDLRAKNFLTAHLISLNARAALAGSNQSNKDIASKTVGDTSATYVQATGSISERDLWLKTTRYGQSYLMLIKNNQGPRVA